MARLGQREWKVQVATEVPGWVRAELVKFAEQEDRTISQIVERILITALDRERPRPKQQ